MNYVPQQWQADIFLNDEFIRSQIRWKTSKLQYQFRSLRLCK